MPLKPLVIGAKTLVYWLRRQSLCPIGVIGLTNRLYWFNGSTERARWSHERGDAMTTPRTCRETDAADEGLILWAEATIDAACDTLEIPVPKFSDCAAQLDVLRERLEAVVATHDSADAADAAASRLIDVLRVQCALLDRNLSNRLRSLSEIRGALSGLRGLSPSDMIYNAPLVLSRRMSFRRTMISTIRGSLWLPQHLHIEGATGDPDSRRFLEFVDGAQFQLSVAPLETELVRKRTGALVTSPADDKRTFKKIVEVACCAGYVATPIVVQGRVIGMLHADRPEAHGSVTADHLDQLEAFAECLSIAFESAVLEEKSARQRSEVDNLCARVDDLVEEVGNPAGAVATDLRRDVVRRTTQPQPDLRALTPREREIMEHVATGATNGQIARCLVISEGTVKSHLKHIAKKLNTPSRAAAVAVFAGLSDAGSIR
jgi:DNA-binding CsgD family transcriptional regulator